MFTVKVVENTLERLLGAPHASLSKVLPSNRVKVEFLKSLTYLKRLQDGLSFSTVYLRNVICNRIECK